MAEEKIALEVAEADFERWADAMDLARKLDPAGLDTEDKKSLADSKRVIIDAMIFGALVVNEAGEFVYTPKAGEDKTPIIFHEPDGMAIMSVDQIGKSGTHDVAKMVAILAVMTKQTRPRFAKMKNRDWTVCQAVFSLFFAR